MIPRKLSRQTPASALQVTTSLVPFLYCTRTIQCGRFYNSNSQSSTPASEGLDESGGSEQRRSQRFPAERQHEQRTLRRDRAREDHIPFENVSDETESVQDQLAGSTITPSEKRIFDQLFQVRREKQDAQDGEDAKQASDTPTISKKPTRDPIPLDTILDSVVHNVRGQRPPPRFPEALRPLAEQARHAAREERRAKRKGVRSTAVPRETEALRAAGNQELDRVSILMQQASTDVEVWKIFEDQVLSKVKALDLDMVVSAPGAQPTLDSKGKEKQALQNQDTASSPRSDINLPSLDLLAFTYPRHLIRFLRHLSTNFPSSPLARAFLPAVKSQGPTSFALGASTSFYNLHLALHSPVHHFNHTDLESMNSILTEMDRDVYDFDEDTSKIIGRTMRALVKLRRGMGGDGVQALFQSHSATRSFKALWRWEKVAEERLQSKALRQAKVQELDEKDYEADLSESEPRGVKIPDTAPADDADTSSIDQLPEAIATPKES